MAVKNKDIWIEYGFSNNHEDNIMALTLSKRCCFRSVSTPMSMKTMLKSVPSNESICSSISQSSNGWSHVSHGLCSGLANSAWSSPGLSLSVPKLIFRACVGGQVITAVIPVFLKYAAVRKIHDFYIIFIADRTSYAAGVGKISEVIADSREK